jgi:phosphate starvation-inducible PhoH-like protein
MPKEVKLQPKSDGQQQALDSLFDPDINYTVITGPAGTGKTTMACYYAARQLAEKRKYKIYIARSVTVIKGEAIGHLPGNLHEKYDPYLVPMIENFKKYVPSFDQYETQVEILPLAQIRGRDISNSVLIVDEAQLLSSDLLKAIITRVCSSSKLVLIGDPKQSDLTKNKTDLEKFCEALEPMDCFELIKLDNRDQVRNGNITEILERLDKSESNNRTNKEGFEHSWVK